MKVKDLIKAWDKRGPLTAADRIEHDRMEQTIRARLTEHPRSAHSKHLRDAMTARGVDVEHFMSGYRW